MKQRSEEAGFTLISVMVAVVLLVIGVLALARTQSLVLAAHSTAGSRTSAVEIARDYLETLRSRDPATLQSEAAIRVDESGAANANGAYTRTVDVQVLTTNLKRVTVQVTTPRSRNPVSLMTMAYVNPNPT
jgi:Tfp pilus assembly protein PilV